MRVAAGRTDVANSSCGGRHIVIGADHLHGAYIPFDRERSADT